MVVKIARNMNFAIEGSNVKVFGKVIQSLAKIGHELSIETTQNDLILRTFNSSQSVFANFTLNSSFFLEYQESNTNKFKVSLKSCLMAFRSLPSIEKSVEKCVIDSNSVDCTIVIEFHCRHGMTKVYHLPILSDEIVPAINYANDTYLCELSVQSSLFSNGVQNFNSGVDDVILAIFNDKVILKNHIDKDLDQGKTVQTELSFDSEEFEVFTVSEEVELMFCLKEFKSILNFAEGFNVPLTCKCPTGGKPLVISVNDIPGLLPDFVLATISAGSESLPSTAVQRVNVSVVQQKRKDKKRNKAKKNQATSESQSSSHQISHFSVPTEDSETQNRNEQNENDEQDNNEMNEEDNNEMVDEEIPSTPPNKRFKLAFLGLYQPSQNTFMDTHPEVLAAATDEEDSE